MGQNAIIQSKVFENSINLMADTIEDMDGEIDQKNNKVDFLEKKRRLPDSKPIEDMNELRLKKISSK